MVQTFSEVWIILSQHWINGELIRLIQTDSEIIENHLFGSDSIQWIQTYSAMLQKDSDWFWNNLEFRFHEGLNNYTAQQKFSTDK